MIKDKVHNRLKESIIKAIKINTIMYGNNSNPENYRCNNKFTAGEAPGKYNIYQLQCYGIGMKVQKLVMIEVNKALIKIKITRIKLNVKSMDLKLK